MHTVVSMFGLNWVDIIIVVLLALAVAEGIRIGLLTQLFMIAGFFVSLFLFGWLFPHLLPIHNVAVRTLVNGGLVLTGAAYVSFRCFDLGQKVHWSFRLGKRIGERKLKLFETVAGAVPGLVAGLAVVWLVGVAIGRLPFVGFSNSVSDSRIVQQLTRSLPAVPAVFAEFDKQVNPNAQPYVFAQPKPQPDFNYSVADTQLAEAKAAASVVRMTGFGCGGLIGATGFVVAPGLVATNAHVIAGVKRSVVKYGGRSYEAVAVSFDPVLDLAILHVQQLPALPLKLAAGNVMLGSTVAVLGYPGGNYRVVPGLVRDTLAVSASDIYSTDTFGRGIYELQTTVDYGSSGSPVVLANGQVAGIIFSKSVGDTTTAFALTSPHIATVLKQAESSSRRVSTGACMVQ